MRLKKNLSHAADWQLPIVALAGRGLGAPRGHDVAEIE